MTKLQDPLATMFPSGLDCLSPYFSHPQSDGTGDTRFKFCVPRKTVDWIKEYESVIDTRSFYHHEPWLTLMALYGLLGDQNDLGSGHRSRAVNRLMDIVYSGKDDWADVAKFSTLAGSQVEVCLPELQIFRKHLKDIFVKRGIYHPYRDRRLILDEKLSDVSEKPSQKSASLEGNTNLDALISGKDDKGRWVHIFIEAKFLSDISKDISYLPVRNQIARNIDCAVELMTERGKNLDGVNDFWFILLTPGLFRTPAYGNATSTSLDTFIPARSRLFCYKMDEYRDPEILKQDLPHWAAVLDDSQWEIISRRIGWMTFEDVVDVVCSESLLKGAELSAFLQFFEERGITCRFVSSEE